MGWIHGITGNEVPLIRSPSIHVAQSMAIYGDGVALSFESGFHKAFVYLVFAWIRLQLSIYHPAGSYSYISEKTQRYKHALI